MSSMSTSTSGQPTGVTDDQNATTDQVTEQAGQAKDQAKHVAGVTGDEAKSVARDVREQARGLLSETTTQVQDQSRTQRDRLVDTLRTLSDDLDGMAGQSQGLASSAAREVSDRARSLTKQLEGREPAELLDELRAFARRRPGMFLAGAAIAGVVAGRVLRGTREAAQGGPSGTDVYGGGDVAATQERPVTPGFEATVTGPAYPATPPAAYPPVTPATVTTETDRPFGGS